MAIIQRLIWGIAWIALTAVGLYLLEPSLFPDFTVPTEVSPFTGPALAGLATADPHHLVGGAIILVAAAIGLAGLRSAFGRPRNVTDAGPMLGADAPDRPRPPAPQPPLRPRAEAFSAAPAAPALDRQALLAEFRIGDEAQAGGRIDAAREHYSAAVEIARSLRALNPEEITARADLADALSRLAGQEQARGSLQPAIALYEEAVELRRTLALTAPDDGERAQALAGALSNLAECRRAHGHVSRARDIYAEVVGLSERLSRLEPQSEAHREALAAVRARIETLRAELKSRRS